MTAKNSTTKPKGQKATQAEQTETAPANITPGKGSALTDDENLSAAGRRARAQALAPEGDYQAQDEDVGDEDVHDVNVLQLLVTRDNTATPVEAFEHEYPIYELIHGEGNVEVISEQTRQVVDLDAQTELDRLYRKFGKNGEKAIEAVYGRSPERLADALGLSVARNSRRNKSSEQAMSIDYSDPGTVDHGRIKVARLLPVRKSATR